MHEYSEVLYPDPGFWTRTSLIQLFYGVMVNLTAGTFGIAFSFSSIMLPQLSEVEPKVMATASEESWIVSSVPLATLVGNVVSGFMMDTYGRRIVLLLCNVPLTVGWFYMGYAATATDLILSRLIVGLGCGMGMIAPRAYVTEISLPNMRGVNGALANVAISLGVLSQAALGAFMTWRKVSFINGFYSLALCFISFIFPETPYFLLMTDTLAEKIELVLSKFRSSWYNVEGEMDTLLEFKEDNRIRRLLLKEQLKLLFSKSACKPFCTIATYIMLSQLVGVNLVLMWTVEMLEESNTSVDAHTGNIVLAVARLVTGLGTAILMLKLGRKHLAIISSLGVFVSFLILGIYLVYGTKPTVLPLLCFTGYIVAASIGYYPLPMLIIFELSPLQIRGILGGLGIGTLNVTTFVVNKFYPSLRNALGYPNVILGFSLLSLLTSVYIYFYLPETKDLTLQEIEEFYNERRPTLTSQRRIRSMQAFPNKLGSSQSRSLMRVRSKNLSNN